MMTTVLLKACWLGGLGSTHSLHCYSQFDVRSEAINQTQGDVKSRGVSVPGEVESIVASHCEGH